MRGLDLIDRGLLEPWGRTGGYPVEGGHPVVSHNTNRFGATWHTSGVWGVWGVWGTPSACAKVASALCRQVCWAIDRPLVDAAQRVKVLRRGEPRA